MACNMATKGERGYSLSILGATSAGKTMLAKLLRSFWNRGLAREHCSIVNWPTHDWQDLETERSAPCIAIDELGRGERGKNGGEWSRFLDFFNFRQERGLWTIVTCNLTWDEIRTIDPAIASRLRRNGGVVLQAGAGVRPFEDRV